MNANLQNVVVTSVLLGARVGALMTFAPFVGSMAVSWRVKGALTVLITFLLYPIHAFQINPYNWLATLCSEFVLGMMFGVAVQLIFESAQLAGQLAGMQIGYSLVTLIDPTTDIDTPVLAVFHQNFALLMFFHIGAFHWLLRGIARSFDVVPPGTVSLNRPALEQLLYSASQMWSVGVHLAAPILAVTILADITLSLINRAAPQLPILFMGISIKSVVGLSVLAAAIKVWPHVYNESFQWAIKLSEHLAYSAR